jgi:hypothetical protein
MQTTRDLFNHDHGPGKGDKPRNKYDANWRERIEAVKFSGQSLKDSGFVRVRGKWVKKFA